MCAYVCGCMYPCMCVYAHVYVCVCMYVCACRYVSICVSYIYNLCVHVYVLCVCIPVAASHLLCDPDLPVATLNLYMHSLT